MAFGRKRPGEARSRGRSPGEAQTNAGERNPRLSNRNATALRKPSLAARAKRLGITRAEYRKSMPAYRRKSRSEMTPSGSPLAARQGGKICIRPVPSLADQAAFTPPAQQFVQSRGFGEECDPWQREPSAQGVLRCSATSKACFAPRISGFVIWRSLEGASAFVTRRECNLVGGFLVPQYLSGAGIKMHDDRARIATAAKRSNQAIGHAWRQLHPLLLPCPWSLVMR